MQVPHPKTGVSVPEGWEFGVFQNLVDAAKRSKWKVMEKDTENRGCDGLSPDIHSKANPFYFMSHPLPFCNLSRY